MWIGIAYQLSFERDYALERREAENDNLARLFEEHVQRTLAAPGVTLKQLEAEYRQHGERLDLEQYWRDRRDELTSYSVLSVVREDGDLILASIPFVKPQNFRNAENFQFHMREASQDIFIAKPRQGTVTGRTTIYLTRRMNKADGTFGGYTLVGMDPQYFSSFYDQIDLGPDSVVVLIGRDGVIRARRSDTTSSGKAVGQDMHSAVLFSVYLKQAENGKFRATSPIDGVTRLYSYRSTKSYPLVLMVGTSEAATLARFEQRKKIYLWAAGVASVLIIAFASLVMIQMSHEDRVMEELRTSEERYALVERATSDVIWDRNLQSGEVYLSPRGKEFFGYRQDELQVDEASFFERVHPDDDASVREALARSARDGAPYRVEYRLRHQDGGHRWVLSRGEVVRNENGEPARMVGSIADITERKRAEQELEHKTKLAQLLEQLARAANEALTPEAAMATCLRRICEEGKWALGRVATFPPGLSPHKPDRSQWFCTEPARYDAFMRYSDGLDYVGRYNVFITRVLRDQCPVWLADLTALETAKFARLAMAAEAGLKAAFAFPVVVTGNVAAFLEFFAAETREPDALLIDGTSSLASQFARMVERGRATEAQARLAAIVEHSDDAIIGRALDGTVTSWNAAAERIFGYTAAEVIGRDPIEIIPPELWQEVTERRSLLKAGQAVRNIETVRATREGRRIDVAISFAPIRDNSGRIAGASAIVRDVTERKQIEKALRENYELLDRIFATTHFCLVYLDRNFNFVRVNKAYADACGQPPGFFHGRNHFEIYPGENVEAIFRRVVATGEPFTIYANPFEFPDHPEWGVTYWDWTLHPLRGEGGDVEGLLFALLDVTERKRAEDALRSYATRLRELSHRLQEASVVERRAISRELHDRIGQELTTLSMMVGMLDARLPRESRSVVQTQLKDMQALLRSVVANVRDVMAELRPPALDDYGLFVALRHHVTEFSRRTGIAVDFGGVDPHPRLPLIVETAMFRISQEALTNILKHAHAKKVKLSLSADSGRVVLDIADDGVGFDAGSAVPDGEEHWGVTTMRERAEAAGITFHLESAPGAGTRVVLEVERAAS